MSTLPKQYRKQRLIKKPVPQLKGKVTLSAEIDFDSGITAIKQISSPWADYALWLEVISVLAGIIHKKDKRSIEALAIHAKLYILQAGKKYAEEENTEDLTKTPTA